MSSRVFFLFAILSLASVGLMAQTNNPAGIWHVQVNESIDLMDPPTRAKFDALGSDAKERAVKAMTGRRFVFSGDGTITVSWPGSSGPRVSAGSWAIDNPPGDLLITIGQKATGFRYQFSSETTLILRAKLRKGFFDNLYLEK